VTKARKLSAEFHRGIDQIVREAELEEARDAIRSASQMNLDRALEQTVDPTGEVNKALQLPSETEIDPVTHIEKPEDPPKLASPEEPGAPPNPPVVPPGPKPEPA
jgi:sec-independent protein translocase protein TatB